MCMATSWGRDWDVGWVLGSGLWVLCLRGWLRWRRPRVDRSASGPTPGMGLLHGCGRG